MDVEMRHVGNYLLSKVEKIPLLRYYARTRGWSFIVAWGHRISGLVLIAFVWLHIHSLSSLLTPDLYDERMRIFRLLIFVLLEWALAIPVIFHALNGGRLILYECYGHRDEEGLWRWMGGIFILYLVLLGLFMLMGDQTVSTTFYWLSISSLAFILLYGITRRIWRTPHGLFWRLQRITAVFLLVMVPAHLLFMHLNPAMGHEASLVVARMRSIFVRALDLLLLIGVLYHGGYGIYSVVSDYLGSRVLRFIAGISIALVTVFFTIRGIGLLFLI